jgi:outer membrane protein
MKRLIILLLFFINIAYSQSPILETYIQKGLEGNLALKQQNLEIEKSLKAIDIARSNLFPKIAFNPNYTLAAGGRKIVFPIGDLLNPVYGTLNQLTQSNNFPTIENEKIQFAPNNFHETKVTFELPLFNPNNKYNILLQQDLAKTEEAKKNLLMFELKYSIETAYYQYIQSLEALKIYKHSGEFLNELLDFNQRLVKNDLALKDVIYSTQQEITKLKTQLTESEKNNKTAKAYFNFLINEPYDSYIEVDTSIFKTIPVIESLNSLTERAIVYRPELAQLSAGKQAINTLLVLQEKNAKLPSFYLGGSTGFQGYGYTFNGQAYAIGQVGMKWDLYHGKEKKHIIQQTQIQDQILSAKQSEVIQQIEMQVVSSYFDVEAALQKIKTSEEGISNTSQLLAILEKRYKNADALYIEVIKAQNDKVTAELQSSLSKFELCVKKAQLDKVSAQ